MEQDEISFTENKKGIIANLPYGKSVIFLFKGNSPGRNVILPKQEHTSNILIYPDEFSNNEHGFDGIIGKADKTLKFGVKTADCLPVFFVSQNIEGVIHAGWRGIVRGIFFELERKLSELGESTENLYLAIGPHICGRCYEVKEDTLSAFLDFSKSAKINSSFIIREGSKFFIDLAKCAYMTLRKIGVRNIAILQVCTKENEKFLSRRRGDMNSQVSHFL